VAGLHKILLVEDNLELRNLYEIFLTYNKYEVATAIDGDDGLKKAKSFKPDLILLDIMMPSKDGFEVLHILRTDPSFGCTKTKIVLLTNLGDGSKLSAQTRQEMDGYVIKAEIVLDDLLKIIASLE
jgi:CheY-like chemotaxis protein